MRREMGAARLPRAGVSGILRFLDRIPHDDRVLLGSTVIGLLVSTVTVLWSGQFLKDPGPGELPCCGGRSAASQQSASGSDSPQPCPSSQEEYEETRPLSESQKRQVQVIHDNLGHPGNVEFLRALRLSRANASVLKYVRTVFQCEACRARGTMPKTRKPAALPRTFRFNQVVGTDVVFIPSPGGGTVPCLNIICWGTAYQIVTPLESCTSAHVSSVVAAVWIRYFGPPEVLVVDQGPEFTGPEFQKLVETHACVLHVIDVRSPWQNGKTERHGDIFKKIVAKARWQYEPTDDRSFHQLLHECVAAKNRLSNRSGFSPLQRVFGIGHRLPAELCSDDSFARDAIDELLHSDPSMEESRRIREAAAHGVITASYRVRIQEASRARHRIRQDFRSDDVVMVWKKPLGNKRGQWTGPGVVVAVHHGSVWVNMRGQLWKCSSEQCRTGTTQESRGLEIFNQLLNDMCVDLRLFPGRRTYVDVVQEGNPPPEADEPVGNQDEGDLPAAPASAAAPAAAASVPGDQTPVGSISEPEACPTPLEPLPEVPELDSPEPLSDAQPSGEVIAEDRERPEPVSKRARVSEELVPADPMDTGGASSSSGPVVPSPVRWEPRPDSTGWQPVATDPLETPSGIPETVMEGDLDLFEWEKGYPVALEPEQWPGVGDESCFATFGWEKCKATGLSAVVLKRSDELAMSEVKKPENWPAFSQSVSKEWSSILATGAVTILTPKKSAEIRSKFPSRILPSRHVFRWKPGDGEGAPPTAKCRWCVLGHRDPDIMKLARASPTPQTTTIYTFLQVQACLQRTVALGDVRTAFMQTDKSSSDRLDGPLFAEVPVGGIILDDGTVIPPGKVLIQLNTAVYGLVNAPSAWRMSMVRALEELGYRRSCYDPCLFILMRPAGPDGMVIIEVDDLASAGNSQHDLCMSRLQQRFKFGKWKSIHESEGDYAGRTIIQNSDYSFHVHQAKFVLERLNPIAIARGRKSQKTSKLLPGEHRQFRAVMGATNWVQRESRPDVSGECSLIMAHTNDPTIADLVDANRVVELLKSDPHLGIRIPHVPVERVRWVSVSDASWANTTEDKSQVGWLVGLADSSVSEGSQASFGLLSWKSVRAHRVIPSTLSAETYSLSQALGECEWLRGLFEEMVNPKFSIVEWASRSRHRGLLVAARTSDNTSTLKECLCVVDAKSLYDHLRNETAGMASDRRTAIEIQIVRGSLDAQCGEIKWVGHPGMYADCLTKRNGNHPLMQHLLRTGRLAITKDAVSGSPEGETSKKSSRSSKSKFVPPA